MTRGVNHLVAFTAVATSTMLWMGSLAASAGEYGPDTCRQGWVWREAVPGDHVCVTPQTRQQSWDDNAQAAARREPGGGPFGPDTCRQGWVWREAVPGDHVCVTPQTRWQALDDNGRAAARVAPNIPPPCQSSGALPSDTHTSKQAVRCSANGYWRVTITAFVHDYWIFGSDAGSSIKVEHFEDDRWVERPARVITAHNDYSPRRAGEAGNTDCPTFGSMTGRCWTPPPPRDCRVENASSIDCRDYANGTPISGVNLNARSVRSSGMVTFGNGELASLPTVIDSF
ncbi:hypothetical protein GCM10010185_51760 [Saccharothrix coeruleofusca]|uniref:Secreted protein n=2 Tax=Saccharothrix coeruleofusca TaxID=33919 RepID=A0A918AQQ4_9PSEU|nr:hypothetical protein GCM10010185_51760 [Saccharothrix coeruleofusca]